MVVLEIGLRSAAVAIAVLIVALFLRDGTGGAPARRYLVLYLLSAASYALSSAPGYGGLQTPTAFLLLVAVLGIPALLWAFAAAAFDDRLKSPWRYAFAWIALVALGLWSIVERQPAAEFAYYGLALALVGRAAWHTLVAGKAAVADAQLRPTVLLAASASIYSAVILLANLLSPGTTASPPFSTVNAAGLLAMHIAFAACWLGVSHVGMRVAPARASYVMAGRDGAAALPPADVHAPKVLEALRQLMERERLHRQGELTIGMLSDRLGVPEYRLRRLINQRLGHRNFSSYVNGYRLAEVKAALADPDQADVPILTIAMDAGFQSLAPFNRAFKASVGMTPSEFRRRSANPSETTG
jgi:AraC-like DNA-binding protein